MMGPPSKEFSSLGRGLSLSRYLPIMAPTATMMACDMPKAAMIATFVTSMHCYVYFSKTT
jgi:hypothetical protein